jgi:type IV secretion system protein TrbB
MNDEQRSRLLAKLRRELGDTVLAALADPSVIEVMLNPDGALWLDKFGEGMVRVDTMPQSQAESLLATIAAMLETTVSYDKPILEGELPLDGSRFEGIVAPVVARPAFAIRKRASRVFGLEDYVKARILTTRDDPANHSAADEASFAAQCRDLSHYQVLKRAIKERKNVLVVGSTGSGKTTFVNALLDGIAKDTPDHRLVLIEDTGEIQCAAANFVQMRSAHHVSMLACLKATMRLRPDRIIVGEVRGAEALALLKAWNTGHPGGLATVHANDAMAGLIRMEQLIQEANVPPQPQLIAEAVNVVAFIARDSASAGGRKVRELISVEGYDATRQEYLVQQL